MEARVTRLHAYVTACALGWAVADAGATDINSNANTSPQIYTDGVWHTTQTLGIWAPSTKELMISYHAECALESDDTTTWWQFQILVDGTPVPPTNDDQALCTGIPPDLNSGALHHWHSVGTAVAKRVSQGAHTVTIRGRIVGFDATEAVRIDDQSLVVLESP